LIKLDAAEHVLVVQSHHIACDGWSERLLFDELKELYEAHRSGSAADLPELALQYTDFANWQRSRLSGDVLGDQLTYWRKELAGAPTAIDLADRPRPAVQTFVGRNLFLSMPRDIADGVRDLAQTERVTPFMLLLAAFATVLYRRSGQDDILIGSPFANRSRREFERIIGFVSNTTVLRARLSGNPTFRELLGRIRETTVGALAHQETPFEKVVEALAPQRDPGVNPLFQVNFRALSEPTPPELSGLVIERLQIDSGTTRFDLALELQLREDGIGGFLKYNTDLFERATIDRIAADLERLLADALKDPDTRVLGFQLASERRPAERAARTPGKGIRGSRERTRPALDNRPPESRASGELVIREATAGDLEMILDLQEEASLATQREIFEPVGYPAETIRARWRTSFESGSSRFMVAEMDGAIVGVSISAAPWLFSIHVARPFWGTGVAKELGDEVMAFVEAAGFDEAIGWVLAENHRSRRYMERMGWRPDGVSRHFREPPHPLMLRYTCDLKRRKAADGTWPVG
jgi:RimJ/RimL family protein N-acetyltransferase